MNASDLDDGDREPYAHWPAHDSERACHEGDCTRCGLEQERDEKAQEATA